MSKRLPNGLTAQQDTFARGLAKGMSQKDAAIAAGYSAKNAESIASRLSRKVNVQSLVESIRMRAAEKAEVDIAYVVGGLKDIADFGRTRRVVSDEMGDTFDKMADPGAANRALELLGKHLGAFIDRSQIELTDSARKHIERLVQIVVDEVADDATRQRIIARLKEAKP